MSMPQDKKKSSARQQKRRLVEETAAKLRDVILAREPGTHIGSLNDVAQLLGVGIVTVQQAARILEHEGLLAVRRGPGGGYYGRRPDNASLERAFAVYMRVHGFGYREALEMATLLDCDIIPSAACCEEERLHDAIRELIARVDTCETRSARARFEMEFRETLLKFVARPLMELVLRVTNQLYNPESSPPIFSGEDGVRAWKTGRQRVLEAILRRDEALARFEAQRYREQVLRRLHGADIES